MDECFDDYLGVIAFSTAMREKLAKKHKEGRKGWNDPDQCTIEFLEHLLHEHYAKGDVVDIANFCMMLHQRGALLINKMPTEIDAANARIKELESMNTSLKTEMAWAAEAIADWGAYERFPNKDDLAGDIARAKRASEIGGV